MSDEIKLSRADKSVKAILRISGIQYSGRKITVAIAEKVRLTNLNWSGGTRTYYYAVPLETGIRGSGMAVKAPWEEQREGMEVALPSGFVVVEHHFFGKDQWVTIRMNPADAPRFLPGRAL